MTIEKPVSKVAELREQAKLTQLQLAAFTDVTVNTIQNWEKGKGIEVIERVLKLCTALDCEIRDLIEYIPSDEPEDTEVQQFTVSDIKAMRDRWTNRNKKAKTKSKG